MLIKIKNLRLKTIIGVQDWERKEQQEIVINIGLDFDGTGAAASDDLADTVDYKALKRSVIDFVEQSRFKLLEALAQRVLDIVLADPTVRSATVEIDKPHALRFCDSVSVTVSGARPR